MAPLMSGLNDEEVRWDKFKNSYMYNDVYYLRRTKFIVYQCATTSVGICSGMAGRAIHNYKHSGHQDDFANLTISTSDLVAVMGLTIAASGIIGTVYTPVIFFDLFWPERWESPLMQTIWKWSAVTGALTQFAAALASTTVIATGHVKISGGSAGEREAARTMWGDREYEYRGPLIIATVVFLWVGVVFSVWSVALMWMAYWHNNKYGPFNKHHARSTECNAVVTEESDLATMV